MEILFSVIIPFGLILWGLHLFYKFRIRGLERIAPKDAILFDYVRWGDASHSITIVKMGVLVLYPQHIALIDSTNNEVFKLPLKKINIEYISLSIGMYISYEDCQYGVKIDSGLLRSTYRAIKRYEVWAQKIEELGGRNFLRDQSMVRRFFFSTIQDKATAIIFIIIVVGGFGYYALSQL